MYVGVYIYIHIYIYIYTCICIYIYLVRLGNVLVFLFEFYVFTVSIGETAAVLQQPETIKTPTTETIKMFLATYGRNHKQTNYGNHENVPCHDGNHKQTFLYYCPLARDFFTIALRQGFPLLLLSGRGFLYTCPLTEATGKEE